MTDRAGARPSRLSAALLRLVTSRERASAILGDLDEERARGGGQSRFWLEWQVWRHAVAEAATLLPASLRASGLIVRDAARSLRSSPGSSLFIFTILAVGIAAATITFSVVDAVVLRPLPFADPDRLVAFEVREATSGPTRVASLSARMLEALRERADTLSAIAGYTIRNETIAGTTTETVLSARVTASLFDVLGARPLRGNAFMAAQEVEGQSDVAVIGYDLWQRRFGGDPAAIGRTLTLSTRTITGQTETRVVTVVAVMPPGFSFPIASDRRPEMWTPFVVTERERTGPDRNSRYLQVVGRLRPAASMAALQSQADAAIAAVVESDRQSFTGQAVTRLIAMRLDESMTTGVRDWMMLALIAVVLVMLVACANVANLMLSRAARRTRELSVRASIGASRRHLMMTMLAESLMLSLGAAAIALAASYWGVEAARASLPAGITRARDIALDVRVLAAGVAAAVATGLLFGAVPAFHAARSDLVGLLKGGALAGGGRRRSWRGVFLAAQVAFVGVLLVATTLFVSSFVHVTRADLGFERSKLLDAGAADLPPQLDDVLQPLASVPGVASVAAMTGGEAPLAAAGFGGGWSQRGLSRAGVPGAPLVRAAWYRVTPKYFDTVGMRVIDGRGFQDSDVDRADIAVIDEMAAKAIFGGERAVGQSVDLRGGATAVVVGVVQNVRLGGPEEQSSAQAYFPTNRRTAGHWFVIRTSESERAVIPAIQTAFARMRPAGARPAQVRRIEDAFRNLTADRRFAAGLMSLFGVLALVIGAAGIYAVMSSLVVQRSRELGIRIALGATTARVVGGVLGQTGRQIAAGLAIGLPIGWAVSRSFGSVLYEVRPTDAAIYAIVLAIIAIVGLAAAVIPARRAARVDPLVTLKAE